MVLWFTLPLLMANFSGYVLVLYVLSRLFPLPTRQLEDRTPDPLLYVLVPTWNERAYLREKIENLLAQAYEPAQLKILICDGGSSDGSIEEVGKLFRDRVEIVPCPERGKINQLNHGLSLVPAHAFVAVSDADSILLRPDSLRLALRYFYDAQVGVVGAWTNPSPTVALPAECAYWDKQNRLRYLETMAGTSSIVTAQFYLARKALLPAFPADCVADDVYIAFAAHTANLRVIYAHEIEAIERRQPRTHRELFFHKFRKANAYTKELLRPLHKIPLLGKRKKFLYLFKIFQFFHLPWIAIAFLGSCALRLYHGDWISVASALAILFFTTLFASFLIEPPPGKIRGGLVPSAIFQTLIVFSEVNLVLLLNSVAFPFWSQDSRYARVGKK